VWPARLPGAEGARHDDARQHGRSKTGGGDGLLEVGASRELGPSKTKGAARPDGCYERE
jgi:hypothetical protein